MGDYSDRRHYRSHFTFVGSPMTCQQCAAKDAVIERQQKEIARLQKVIRLAQIVCDRLIGDAERVMSGNQPRGKWSFARGAKEAAEAIYRRLAG